jgi:hypothetical protein
MWYWINISLTEKSKEEGDLTFEVTKSWFVREDLHRRIMVNLKRECGPLIIQRTFLGFGDREKRSAPPSIFAKCETPTLSQSSIKERPRPSI